MSVIWTGSEKKSEYFSGSPDRVFMMIVSSWLCSTSSTFPVASVRRSEMRPRRSEVLVRESWALVRETCRASKTLPMPAIVLDREFRRLLIFPTTSVRLWRQASTLGRMSFSKVYSVPFSSFRMASISSAASFSARAVSVTAVSPAVVAMALLSWVLRAIRLL